VKLVSRAAWGARGYRLPSGATLYAGSRRRGVKLHYLGTAYSDRTHDRCDDYVRQIQAQHMDGNGWSDIGYSFVVCTHGYVYEGRGLRRRNSANGSTTLNEQDYAVCLLVGSSGLTRPTDAQLHGARDAIDYCRTEGPAGTWLGGHRDGYATTCPGDAVYTWAKKGAPRPASTTTPTAPAPSEEDDVSAFDVWAYKGTGETADAYAYLRTTARNVAGLTSKVDALTAVNANLVDAVAKLAADLGDLDPTTIVTELRQAIESVEVRLDVPDTPPA
jgi:hypothetical protein